MLRRCDLLVLMPHWYKSVGSKAELHEAQHMGKHVFGTTNPTEAEWHAQRSADAWRNTLVSLDTWARLRGYPQLTPAG